MRMFEFNKNKSEANLQKHGIDFVAAQQLWEDPDLLEIHAKATVEERFLIIGRIEGKHWSAVVAYRKEIIRIISV
ncbi:MAG: BrnT family toxin, partial [Gammaproteobacteria bacterium]|nr:BrnT family toxin [Gammaproteobacteria bacterium]